jgi:hypothetical protein
VSLRRSCTQSAAKALYTASSLSEALISAPYGPSKAWRIGRFCHTWEKALPWNCKDLLNPPEAQERCLCYMLYCKSAGSAVK